MRRASPFGVARIAGALPLAKLFLVVLGLVRRDHGVIGQDRSLVLLAGCGTWSAYEVQ